MEIDKNNKHYKIENGVLYNYDKTILYRYSPRKNDKAFTVPSSVSRIMDYAFENSDNLESISFENSIGWAYLDYDDSDNEILKTIDLSNQITNVSYLTDEYVNFEFKKS